MKDDRILGLSVWPTRDSYEEMIKLNVRFPNEVIVTLRQKSKLTGLPMAAIVRNQLEKVIAREDHQRQSSTRTRDS